MESIRTSAAAILSENCRDDLLALRAITGLGVVNEVYRARGRRGDYILRLNRQDKAAWEYPKESWCIARAREAGIPVPAVLGMGYRGPFFYQLLEYLEGTNATLLPDDNLLIWETLGDYARRLAAVPVEGFGDRLLDPNQGRFDDSWERYLDYNIDELHDADPLRRYSFFTAKIQQRCREILQSLRTLPLHFGLRHGDLTPRNALVGKEQVYLLDWGESEVHVEPAMDLGELLYYEQVGAERIARFWKGYGREPEELQALLPLVRKLYLLKRLDKFRWAHDHQVANLQDFVEQVRAAVLLVHQAQNGKTT